MPRVVQPVMRNAEGNESRAMHVSYGFAIKATKQPLTRRNAVEVLLEMGPRPFRDAHDSIARVGLGAPRPYFASRGVDV
ncbi:MAG TPA: hypothetical protein VF785_05790 [Gemmatimonadaceae bacterium]